MEICAACFQMTFRALLVGLLLGVAFSLITLKLNITAGEPELLEEVALAGTLWGADTILAGCCALPLLAAPQL